MKELINKILVGLEANVEKLFWSYEADNLPVGSDADKMGIPLEFQGKSQVKSSCITANNTFLFRKDFKNNRSVMIQKKGTPLVAEFEIESKDEEILFDKIIEKASVRSVSQLSEIMSGALEDLNSI